MMVWHWEGASDAFFEHATLESEIGVLQPKQVAEFFGGGFGGDWHWHWRGPEPQEWGGPALVEARSRIRLGLEDVAQLFGRPLDDRDLSSSANAKPLAKARPEARPLTDIEKARARRALARLGWKPR